MCIRLPVCLFVHAFVRMPTGLSVCLTGCDRVEEGSGFRKGWGKRRGKDIVYIVVHRDDISFPCRSCFLVAPTHTPLCPSLPLLLHSSSSTTAPASSPPPSLSSVAYYCSIFWTPWSSHVLLSSSFATSIPVPFSCSVFPSALSFVFYWSIFTPSSFSS